MLELCESDAENDNQKLVLIMPTNLTNDKKYIRKKWNIYEKRYIIIEQYNMAIKFPKKIQHSNNIVEFLW